MRYGHPISAMMVDLDHFKVINDRYGHAAGDQVLQGIARRCGEHLRKIDILGRYGGDEFAILLPETDLDDAVQAAERLRIVIAASPVLTESNQQLTTTVSIGVATLDPNKFDEEGFPNNPFEHLLDQADQALYESKTDGRNLVSSANYLFSID